MNENLQFLCSNWEKWQKDDFVIWFSLIEDGKLKKFKQNFEILLKDPDSSSSDDDDSSELDLPDHDIEEKPRNGVESVLFLKRSNSKNSSLVK